MDIKKLITFIDKQKIAFICSVDEAGFPNIKAMLRPRKREDLKVFACRQDGSLD